MNSKDPEKNSNSDRQAINHLQKEIEYQKRVFEQNLKSQKKECIQRIENLDKRAKYDNKWKRESAEMFMKLYKSRYPKDPFVNKSKILPNNNILFLADSLVHKTHVKSLLMMLFSNNRMVHLNTGTHGLKDGSTVFWQGPMAYNQLTNEKDRKKKKEFVKFWQQGAQTFMNEDLNLIMDTFSSFKKFKISLQIVSDQSHPQYPVYLDTINAWCYSNETPRCPLDIYKRFKLFYLEEAEIFNQFNQKIQDRRIQDAVKEIMAHKEKHIVDNVLTMILHALRMVQIPKEDIMFIANVFKEKLCGENQEIKDLNNKLFHDSCVTDIVSVCYKRIFQQLQPQEKTEKIHQVDEAEKLSVQIFHAATINSKRKKKGNLMRRRSMLTKSKSSSMMNLKMKKPSKIQQIQEEIKEEDRKPKVQVKKQKHPKVQAEYQEDQETPKESQLSPQQKIVQQGIVSEDDDHENSDKVNDLEFESEDSLKRRNKRSKTYSSKNKNPLGKISISREPSLDEDISKISPPRQPINSFINLSDSDSETEPYNSPREKTEKQRLIEIQQQSDKTAREQKQKNEKLKQLEEEAWRKEEKEITEEKQKNFIYDLTFQFRTVNNEIRYKDKYRYRRKDIVLITKNPSEYDHLKDKYKLILSNYNNKYFVGRESANNKNDVKFSKKDDCVSRRQMLIQFQHGAFWAKDLSTTGCPCYLVVTNEHPVMLRKDMMIKAGDKNTQYIQILKVRQRLADQVTQDGTQLVRMVNKSDLQADESKTLEDYNEQIESLFQRGKGKEKGYIKFLVEIYDEEMDEVEKVEFEFEAYHGEKIPLVNDIKQFKYQQKQFRQATHEKSQYNLKGKNPKHLPVDIVDSDYDDEDENYQINHWGDLCYEKMCGWYIRSSKQGSQSQLGLKIWLKNVREFKACVGSQKKILIQPNMTFGFKNYSFQFNHIQREVEQTQNQQKFIKISRTEIVLHESMVIYAGESETKYMEVFTIKHRQDSGLLKIKIHDFNSEDFQILPFKFQHNEWIPLVNDYELYQEVNQNGKQEFEINIQKDNHINKWGKIKYDASRQIFVIWASQRGDQSKYGLKIWKQNIEQLMANES